MKIYLLLFCFICCTVHYTAAQSITVTEQGRPCSIRGLSVVNNQVAWASGSKGSIAITHDGGKTWTWQQVKGFEQADFRDIEAFSDQEAIIMSSGTPAVILKTTDGGTNWLQVYRNDDKAYFLDAMDFTPDGKQGYILGDPIDGKFLILETLNGGNTWNRFKYQPDAMPGEAAFAASGTCLRVDKHNTITIVTGGIATRLIRLTPQNHEWYHVDLPVTHGISSKGAFSISDDERVVVGGNYADPKQKDSTSCTNLIKGVTDLLLAKVALGGYQSCVEHISKATYLSTGTSGSNLSNDSGQTWKQIDNTSFNVCRKAKQGNLVLLAGDQGKIAIFKN